MKIRSVLALIFVVTAGLVVPAKAEWYAGDMSPGFWLFILGGPIVFILAVGLLLGWLVGGKSREGLAIAVGFIAIYFLSRYVVEGVWTAAIWAMAAAGGNRQ